MPAKKFNGIVPVRWWWLNEKNKWVPCPLPGSCKAAHQTLYHRLSAGQPQEVR